MESCRNCGSPVYEGVTVCTNCGQNVYEQPYYERGTDYPPPARPEPAYPHYPPPRPPVQTGLPMISIAIVVVVIIAVLGTVFGVILISYSSDDGGSSGYDGDGGSGGSTGNEVKITMANPHEYSYCYKLEIVKVSGGSLRTEDAKFQIYDDNTIRVWEAYTYQANPYKLTIGLSTVYAVPYGWADRVTDSSTASVITPASMFQNYQNCSFCYLDADSDGKFSAGDTIYIYKDPDDDGTDEVSGGYVLKIWYGEDLVSMKEL